MSHSSGRKPWSLTVCVVAVIVPLPTAKFARNYAPPAQRMHTAVVGHVEWIEFGRVEHVPAAGEIVHVGESWEVPGGGGAVAAVQLCRLAGAATLYTAFGDDELGHRSKEELERL